MFHVVVLRLKKGNLEFQSYTDESTIKYHEIKQKYNYAAVCNLRKARGTKFRTRDIVRIDMRQLALRRPFANQFRGKLFAVKSHTRIDHATLY